jgi:FixJ family two-component response regulator
VGNRGFVPRLEKNQMSLGRRLLIVAPDTDLRQSLEFMLEADGYEVVSYPTIEAVQFLERFDCTILDHRAIAPPIEAVMAFCRLAIPVILLAGTPVPWLEEMVFCLVQKPLLGGPLLAAIESALGAGLPPATPK